MILNINQTEFEEFLNTKESAIIDIWADWCGPCKMLSPILEDVSKEIPDFKILKINADSNKELLQKLNVRSIPTLLYVKDGAIIDRSVGLLTKNLLINKIQNLK